MKGPPQWVSGSASNSSSTQGQQGSGQGRGSAPDAGLLCTRSSWSCCRRYAGSGRCRHVAQASRAADRPVGSAVEQVGGPGLALHWPTVGRTSPARPLTRRSGLSNQLADLNTQLAGLQQQEEKLTQAASQLQAKVEAFRTKKGDHQGHLLRRRGADQDQRGCHRYLKRTGGCRPRHPAGRGQDPADDRQGGGAGRVGVLRRS